MKKFITLIYILFSIYSAHAQWSTNSAVNNAICTASGNQGGTTIINDGLGGFIITWTDSRSGNQDIYAQRIDANGIVQWTANGVAVCTASGNQLSVNMVSDGSGGAIIIWVHTSSSFDIYAQHINASGIVQWTANGVAICTAQGNQSSPSIVSDDMGGAIITWDDNRNVNMGVYAQRINANGIVQWTTDGVGVITGVIDQQMPASIKDGSGGVIITWVDYRNGSNNTDIYSQRINANGVVQWTTNGVAICTATFNQNSPRLISDGSGGSIITWEDSRNGSNINIYAQRINASGAVQWTINGVAIYNLTGGSTSPRIVSDESGGAIIAWNDIRTGSNHNIYSQRINASGSVQWTANGVAICTATGNQVNSNLSSDALGGAIISWGDYRSGTNTNHIYSQRINASGVVQWTANGVAISTATDNNSGAAIVSDGSSGAILTWSDSRSGSSDQNIYAQNICSNGTIGPCIITSISENYGSGIQSWITMDQLNIVLNGDILGIIEGQRLTLNLFDISGRLLKSNKGVISQNAVYKIDISDLAQGIYVVNMQTENNIYSSKIVVGR